MNREEELVEVCIGWLHRYTVLIMLYQDLSGLTLNQVVNLTEESAKTSDGPKVRTRLREKIRRQLGNRIRRSSGN